MKYVIMCGGNYVKWDKAIAENIDFGNRTAEDVMLSLLIDDGDEERVHRNVMFNKQLKYFGVGVSEHKEYGVCVVIDYIGQIDGYVDKKLDNEFQKMKSEENKSLNNNNNNNKTTLKLKLGSEFYKKNMRFVVKTFPCLYDYSKRKCKFAPR